MNWNICKQPAGIESPACIGGNLERKLAVVFVSKHLESQANLLELTDALRLSAASADLLQRRQQQRRQDGNDRNDQEQLDQSERFSRVS